MGRPKNFSREEVLEKAMPVFWKHGFSDTSLQKLERATGVNKSGLYPEFRDKQDLFVACLRHYLDDQEKRGLLTKEPLGWDNVEAFLKHGPLNEGEQKGCFSVNSMRPRRIDPQDRNFYEGSFAVSDRIDPKDPDNKSCGHLSPAFHSQRIELKSGLPETSMVGTRS